jgi:hypothetical protein
MLWRKVNFLASAVNQTTFPRLCSPCSVSMQAALSQFMNDKQSTCFLTAVRFLSLGQGYKIPGANSSEPLNFVR